MKNCLFKELKSSANNEELLKVGEIKIKVGKPYDSASYGSITIHFNNLSEVIYVDVLEGRIKPSPTGTYTTHIDLLPNSGSTVKAFYFDEEVVLSITNKYNIKGIEGSFSLAEVYGYGNFAKMANTIQNLILFDNMYSDKFGNVNTIINNYDTIRTNFILDGNKQKLAELALCCPGLRMLECTNLEGNLSSISNMASLEFVKINDFSIEGDVSQLSVKRFLSTTSNYLNFSWSSRSASKEIVLGDLFLATTDDRKRMLVDNSNCVRSDTSTLGTIKTLSVDTTDPEVAAALTALRAKNVEVKRENNTVIN